MILLQWYLQVSINDALPLKTFLISKAHPCTLFWFQPIRISNCDSLILIHLIPLKSCVPQFLKTWQTCAPCQDLLSNTSQQLEELVFTFGCQESDSHHIYLTSAATFHFPHQSHHNQFSMALLARHNSSVSFSNDTSQTYSLSKYWKMPTICSCASTLKEITLKIMWWRCVTVSNKRSQIQILPTFLSSSCVYCDCINQAH